MRSAVEQAGKPENEAAARAKALYEYAPTSIYSAKYDRSTDFL